MTDEMKEIIRALTNAENVETIAKLTEAIGKTEEALQKRDEELRAAKDKMVEWVFKATGTEEERIEDENNEVTPDEILSKWAVDPQGEFEKTKGNKKLWQL